MICLCIYVIDMLLQYGHRASLDDAFALRIISTFTRSPCPKRTKTLTRVCSNPWCTQWPNPCKRLWFAPSLALAYSLGRLFTRMRAHIVSHKRAFSLSLARSLSLLHTQAHILSHTLSDTHNITYILSYTHSILRTISLSYPPPPPPSPPPHHHHQHHHHYYHHHHHRHLLTQVPSGSVFPTDVVARVAVVSATDNGSPDPLPAATPSTEGPAL